MKNENYLHSPCFGCGGFCCQNISMWIGPTEIERFSRVGNIITHVESVTESDSIIVDENTGGVLYVESEPYHENENPDQRVFRARLPGKCAALNKDGSCAFHKHPDKPTLCNNFTAGVNCDLEIIQLFKL